MNLSVRNNYDVGRERLSVYADKYPKLRIFYEIFMNLDLAFDSFGEHPCALAGYVYELGVRGDLFQEGKEVAGFWY